MRTRPALMSYTKTIWLAQMPNRQMDRDAGTYMMEYHTAMLMHDVLQPRMGRHQEMQGGHNLMRYKQETVSDDNIWALDFKRNY